MIHVKKRAIWAGISILGAYAILAGVISDNNLIVVPLEVLAGLFVIAIPLLLIPSFQKSGREIKELYLIGKIIEGVMMIGAAFLLLTNWENAQTIRDVVYKVHPYIFIGSAALLYTLFYREKNIPTFIAVWGYFAVVTLLIGNVFQLLGIEHSLIPLLFLPIILNELILAVYLIVKGLPQLEINEIKAVSV